MISDADDSLPPKLVGRTQRILLELSTIFYFFARNAAIPLVQQYIYHLVARKYNLTDAEAAAAADADEGLRPVTNASTTGDDQLQTATDGQLVCIAVVILSLLAFNQSINQSIKTHLCSCLWHQALLTSFP